jgi:hypothetical protein
MRRFKLGTLILWIMVLALVMALFIQQRRERRLQSLLAIYRDRGHEALLDRMTEPVALVYADDTPLEDVLKQIKPRTKGPGLPNGIPIYVDPIGLQEANVSMMSPVKFVAMSEDMPLEEFLRRMLKPLGLAPKATSGFLMITCEESLDEEKDGHDPYYEYRDILK